MADGEHGEARGQEWLTAEEQRVWRQWLAVQSKLPAALGRRLQADSGLSLQDFSVLVHLSEARGGRLRASALSEALEWEQSRLSHHLRRMEARGLVRRDSCDDDRRGSWVALTPEGRSRLADAAPGHAQAVLDLLFRRLDPGQLAVLDDVTAAVLDALPEHDPRAAASRRATC